MRTIFRLPVAAPCLMLAGALAAQAPARSDRLRLIRRRAGGRRRNGAGDEAGADFPLSPAGARRWFRCGAGILEDAGAPAIHPAEAEYAIVVAGAGTLVSGGTMADPETTNPKLVQGSRIEGGTTRRLGPGDIFMIPAGVPPLVRHRRRKPRAARHQAAAAGALTLARQATGCSILDHPGLFLRGVDPVAHEGMIDHGRAIGGGEEAARGWNR